MLKAFKQNCAYVLLFIIVIVFYFQTIHFGFIWDDFSYIVNNSNLAQGTNLFDLWFKRISVDFWPITYSSFWILKYFFGNDPTYYHIFNVSLFFLSISIIYNLLKRLQVKNYLLLTIIFAIHPMNVSNVSWAFQAKTNLANVFGLLSCIYFLKYFEKQRNKYYLLSFVFMLCSFLSKVSLIMIPVVFLIFLIKKDRDTLLKNILKTSPFFVLALVIGITNVLWDKNSLPVPESELILNKDWLFRFALMGQNFWFYIKQTFFPIDLMFVHHKIEPDLHTIFAYLPSICLLLILSYFIYDLLKNRQLSNVHIFSVFISFLFLFPVLGLSEIYYMRFSYVAEHYLTLGMVGFLFPLIYFLHEKPVGKVVTYIFITALAYQSFNYIPEYESEKKLFEANIVKNPNNILPHNVLGLLYKNENNYEKAMYHYNRSIEIHPNAASYYNRAHLYELTGQLDLAKTNYEKAIELNPYVANSYNNLAVVYTKLKNIEMALNYFNRAIQADPSDVRYYYNIGYTYEENRNYKESLIWYERVLKMQPNNMLFKEAVERVSKQIQ